MPVVNRTNFIVQAKRDFEKRKARDEEAKMKGDDKWMLPELQAKLEKSKDKKSKKKKKEKKKKKYKKEKNSMKSKKDDLYSSDSDSEDEWVEKTSETAAKPPDTGPLKRDDWMTTPSFLPTFSTKDKSERRTSKVSEEEAARKLIMERPGQTGRELNPYWKNGGTGLPPEKAESRRNEPSSSASKHHDRRDEKSSRSRSRSRSPSRKRDRRSPEKRSSYQRPSEGDEDSYTSALTRRYGLSQPGWKKSVERPRTPHSSSGSSSESSSEDERPSASTSTSRTENEEEAKIWSEQELNALNAKIIKAEIMGNQSLVDSLKRTLASAKEQTERLRREGVDSKERVVTLTRTDGKGGHHPLPAPRYGEESLKGSKGKGKKNRVETHEKGQRVRYFADDDRQSLNDMVMNLNVSIFN